MATDQIEGMLVDPRVEIQLIRGMDSFHCYKGGDPFLCIMKLRSFVRSTLNGATMNS